MFRVLTAALFGMLSLSACAQPAPPAAKTTTAAAASPRGGAEQSVRAALTQLDPNFKPDYIGAAPFPGFREVVVSGQVLYVSDDGKYLMQSQPRIEQHVLVGKPTGLVVQLANAQAPLAEAVGELLLSIVDARQCSAEPGGRIVRTGQPDLGGKLVENGRPEHQSELAEDLHGGAPYCFATSLQQAFHQSFHQSLRRLRHRQPIARRSALLCENLLSS